MGTWSRRSPRPGSRRESRSATAAISLPTSPPPSSSCNATNVTLFEGTLLAGRRQARVDILRKRGSHIDLIEVKAKSFDGAKHTASLADGRKGALRAAKKPFPILSDWIEKLEDITYQVLLLEEILPGVTVHPWLMLVDKSKRAQVDDIPDLFRLEWDTNADGSRRLRTARYIGDRGRS